MTDIRLDVDLFNHPKTKKLKRQLGLEGVFSLIKLWMWAAKNRPEGKLINLDIEDIEIAAEWEGKPGTFHATLVTLRWLDVINQDGNEIYALHDWLDHNTWVADSVNRGDRARLSRLAGSHPKLYTQLIEAGKESITRDEYLTLTKSYDRQTTSDDRQTTVNAASTPPPSPSPSPSPDPVIKEDKDTKNQKGRQTDPPNLTQAQQETLEFRAKQCAGLLPKFGGYSARSDDAAWFESLYTDPKNAGIDIYREVRDALKWTNKKDLVVKNVRAYIVNWLEKLQKTRRPQ